MSKNTDNAFHAALKGKELLLKESMAFIWMPLGIGRKKLLENLLGQKDQYGRDLLHLAAENGHAGYLRMLLDAGRQSRQEASEVLRPS